jgi:hypothetical protein
MKTLLCICGYIAVVGIVNMGCDYSPNKTIHEIKEAVSTIQTDSPIQSNDMQLFWAIEMKESGGDEQAVGKDGELGPFQIMEAYWIDGCEQLKIDYSSAEWDWETNARNRTKCMAIMRAYWERYHAYTWEEKARCHNSGSKWKKKYAKTDKYWKDVKGILDIQTLTSR